jgi:hypothetical protein
MGSYLHLVIFAAFGFSAQSDFESTSRQLFSRLYGGGLGGLQSSDFNGSVLVFPEARFSFAPDGSVGQIWRYTSFEGEAPSAGVLSEDAAVNRAKTYFAELGFSDALEPMTALRRGYWPQLGGTVLQMWFYRVRNGVAFDTDGQVIIWLHPVSGELRHISVEPINDLPSVQSVIPAEEGRARLLAAILPRARSQVLVEDPYGPLRLLSAKPQHFDKDFPRAAEADELIRQGRSMLTYYMRLMSLDGKERWIGWVDAATGRLAGLSNPKPGGFGAPEESHKFAWDLGRGEITASVGERRMTVADADISLVGPAKLGKLVTPVILTRGRLVIRANFDPTSGLLYVGGEDRAQAGKPSPGLLKALKRLASAK